MSANTSSFVLPAPFPLGPAATHRPAPDAPTAGAWLAVWTRSRHEHRVFDQLRQKNLEAFLPTITRWSRWKDRKKQVEWPLFPGYCFVHIDPAESLSVLKCLGVVSLVSCDGRPAPIPDQEIQGIRTLLVSELSYDACPLIKVGQMVEVIGGPLRGVVGRLTRKGAHARLTLNVNLIGQGVSVQIDACDVKPY